MDNTNPFRDRNIWRDCSIFLIWYIFLFFFLRLKYFCIHEKNQMKLAPSEIELRGSSDMNCKKTQSAENNSRLCWHNFSDVSLIVVIFITCLILLLCSPCIYCIGTVMRSTQSISNPSKKMFTWSKMDGLF